MHVSAHLDLDLLAHETDDTLSLLVELAAPPAPVAVGRAPSALQVVLDRSGSMHGDRLEGAKEALLAVVDRLDPGDCFGLVVFDDEAAVVVPAGPLLDKPAVKAAIRGVRAGRQTDLCAGLLRGVQEAQRVGARGTTTLLLVSDGHANAGVVDPDALGAVAERARSAVVTTSTLGYGLGYDEVLLAAIARGGRGNELFAENPDDAGAAIAGEVDGLLDQVAQAASVLVRMSPHVRGLQLLNDLPAAPVGGGVMVELGGLYGGETRRLVLTLDVPGIPALGLTEVATLEVTWVELPALVSHTATLPVTVNVVPGDTAAGRVPDPVVRSELAYQRTQQAKRRASRHLTAGDAGAALHELRVATALAEDAWQAAPAAARADWVQEREVLSRLATETESGLVTRAAKLSSRDASRKSRTRGRG